MTYAELGIPYAREHGRHNRSIPGYIALVKAHAKEMARNHAKTRNWGWVIMDTSMCSKTSKGYLTTRFWPLGHYASHKWEAY